MLSLVPGLQVTALERCSGHGGSFGVRVETHDVAVKVGLAAAQGVLRDNKRARGEETEREWPKDKKPIVKTFGGHPIGKPHGAAPTASEPTAARTPPPPPPTASTPTPSKPRVVRPHSVSSDCPLAADHLAQIVRDTASVDVPVLAPIQLLARSMGVSSSDQKPSSLYK
jgi:hypothetical protein